jgi:hypothetical protein
MGSRECVMARNGADRQLSNRDPDFHDKISMRRHVPRSTERNQGCKSTILNRWGDHSCEYLAWTRCWGLSVQGFDLEPLEYLLSTSPPNLLIVVDRRCTLTGGRNS